MDYQISSYCGHIRISTNKRSLIHPAYHITRGIYGECEQSVIIVTKRVVSKRVCLQFSEEQQRLNNRATHNVYCGDKSSLKVVLLFLVFFLFAFVIFSHSSSAKRLSAYAWISVIKFASRARQLSSTSRSKSKTSESLLVSELESLVSYLRSSKILALLKIVR